MSELLDKEEYNPHIMNIGRLYIKSISPNYTSGEQELYRKLLKEAMDDLTAAVNFERWQYPLESYKMIFMDFSNDQKDEL